MNKILIFSIMREVIPPHTKKEDRKKKVEVQIFHVGKISKMKQKANCELLGKNIYKTGEKSAFSFLLHHWTSLELFI